MHYLSYQEKEIPFKIDFSVIKNVCNALNLKLNEFDTVVNDTDATITTLYEAIKRGHKLESIVFNYSLEDVEEILSTDGNYGTFLQAYQQDVLIMATPTDKKKPKAKVQKTP